MRRIEARAHQRLLRDLCDDLRDIVRIFVRRVVVELAPEASVDDSLLQTYIGTGSELRSPRQRLG